AYIDHAAVESAGDISVTATNSARISAYENSSVSATSGKSLGRGAVIATNQVLGEANAYLQDSSVTTTGTADLVVDAENVAQVDATTLTSVSGKAGAVSVLAAFNMIGWESPYGLLSNIGPAFLGDDIVAGDRPAEVKAYLKNTDVQVGGSLTLSADSLESLFSTSSLTADDLDDL
ncbi:MAG: hypothetical protein GY888_32925, partial [Planctomycetaceae bacterium]|nr:hypothetical protein [Planctomycetaceae bacterium]